MRRIQRLFTLGGMALAIVMGTLPLVATGTVGLLHTFNDPTITNGNVFGDPVALDGSYLLVGALGHDLPSLDVGQAHLFDISSGELLHIFDDPTPTTRDFFGRAVAINGQRVLIGANGDDTNGANVGQAHLFDVTTGSLIRTFDHPNGTSTNFFGVSVAFDQDRVLIGAPLGTGIGRAYLFDADSGRLLHEFGDPSQGTGTGFGIRVALQGDNVLIGSPSWSTEDASGVGQVHLFDATTGEVLRTFNDPTPTDRDSFGGSLSISGNKVLIGASGDDTVGTDFGQAHLFDATDGSLLHTFDDPTPTNRDLFGDSVAIDEGFILVGASGDRTLSPDDGNLFGVGQAHLFDADTGDLIRTYNDSTATSGDLFGRSVALQGIYAAVGAPADDTNGPNVGQAHLFDITIPEPSTLVLLLSIAWAMGANRRRDR